MIAPALFLTIAQAEESLPAEPHPLDVFMRDVTEACLLPNLETTDPRTHFSANGWKRKALLNSFEKRISGKRYSVSVIWPASKMDSASCSFESKDVTPFQVYDWFKKRIGEPQVIAWSDKQVGGWRMETNGHDAGVYISPGKRAGMALHILQKWD